MNFKKFLSVMLVTVMATGTLIGCSSSSSSTTTSSTTTTTTTTTEEATTEEVAEGNGIITTGLTDFTYWLRLHHVTSAMVTDLNDHPSTLRFEETTGVYVDYISAPVGQETEQMNLLLASGKDMPDVIKYDLSQNYRGGVEGAIEDKVILDITDLVAEHAPNYMAFLEADDSLRKDAYTDTGSLAFFGSNITSQELKGQPVYGPMINKTMLDKTGLDIPVTIADWEEMLTAFKELGAIPYTFGELMYGAFSGAYGVHYGATFFQDDSVVKFSPMEDGYLEFLTLFNRWYENGLLDSDYLSHTTMSVATEMNGGNVGSAILNTNTCLSVPLASEQLGIERVELVPAPYPVVNEGDQLTLRHYTTGFTHEPVFITTSAEDPVGIIQWFNYMYSEEGINEQLWGLEGDGPDDLSGFHYIKEDGTKDYTDLYYNNPDGLSLDQAQRYYSFRDSMTHSHWDAYSLMYQDPCFELCWNTWSSNATDEGIMPPTLTMTLDESDEYSRLMSDITTYTEEMTAKFIMGIEPLENFDSFRATLERMGIEKCIEIQQAALDRYHAR